jgi:hypothetical protein
MANPPNRSDVGDQNAVAAAIAGDAALQRLAMRDVPPARPSPPARRPEGFRWRAERERHVHGLAWKRARARAPNPVGPWGAGGRAA